MSMDKDKYIHWNRFTIIYYDLCRKLGIDWEAYMILERLLKFSKRNQGTLNISQLVQYFNLSRNTIKKYLDCLINQGYIEVHNSHYEIDYRIKEFFEEFWEQPNVKYCKIFHEHRDDNGLSIKGYALLYVFYSLSLNKNGRAHWYSQSYINLLQISERAFFHIKKLLMDKKLIEERSGHIVYLTKNVKKEFEELTKSTGQKLHK